MNKDLIPLIRKITPKLLAQDIVGVQPMQGPVGQIFTMPTKRLTYEVVEDIVKPIPENHVIVFVNVEIAHWIEQQPIYLWKPYDIDSEMTKQWVVKSHYIISEELLTLLVLTWA